MLAPPTVASAITALLALIGLAALSLDQKVTVQVMSLVVAATTAAYPGFPERIEILGSKGTAVLEGTVLQAAFADGTVLEVGDPAAGGGTGADPMAFPHAYHQALIADFLAAIRENRDPLASGRQALKVHRLIDGILASRGQMIPLSG